MEARSFPYGESLAALVLLVVLATAGAFRFLWVFPLDAGGLPLWLLVLAADILLYRLGQPGRPFLWVGGLLFFSARQGVPGVGIALAALPVVLWLGMRLGWRWTPLLAVPLALLGHDARLLEPSLGARLADWRFSMHLVTAFVLFRMISWLVVVGQRRARPSFLFTLEYFLAPAFWLSPLHAAHLLVDRMGPPDDKPVPARRALSWIVTGFAHALAFSVFAAAVIPRLEERFRTGASSWRWWEWVGVGPALFAVSYLEKARVSYVAAGALSLTGHDVEPDFRSPWFARDLLDYWRRFHYWLWEYYMDLIYMPIVVTLKRRGVPLLANVRLALFTTFAVGTTLVHWVHYPAPFGTALALGMLYGAATVASDFLPAMRCSRWVVIPLTWLTVFVLYFMAYPAFGLGWSLGELGRFFGR